MLTIPPGEAPDEPAHLQYVDHILSRSTLPDPADPDHGYESHQPPLAYVAMAATARLAGHQTIRYPFERDPSFRFDETRHRMHRPPSPSPEIRQAEASVHAARAANTIWGALCSAMTLLLCWRLTTNGWVAFGAAAPFCLSPQLLFASATANNDALLVALSAMALLFMIGTLIIPTGGRATLASAVSGVASGAKVSAAALAPSLAVVALVLSTRRRWKLLGPLLIPALAFTVVWIWLNLHRAGTLLPGVQTGWQSPSAGTFTRLIEEPWWIVQVWVGFWAKLGWFNVPLPMVAYLLFVPPTLFAARGALELLSRRRSPIIVTLVLVVVTNFALLIVYLLTADWQPQGRYLFPALPALAGLATAGLERARTTWARAIPAPLLALLSLLQALAAASLTIVVAGHTYDGSIA
jgi:hypothetical protein